MSSKRVSDGGGNNSLYRSQDYAKGSLISNAASILHNPPLASIPLEVNFDRYQQNVTGRADRAVSRMRHLHQYLENQRDEDGLQVGNKKEKFHFLNDHLYQAETKRKLEAREISDLERRAVSRRHVHQSLEKQINHHKEVQRTDLQIKQLMHQ